jgi:hypothetical protein
VRSSLVLFLMLSGGCGRISFQHHERRSDAGADADTDAGPLPDAGPPCAYQCSVDTTLPEGTGTDCAAPTIGPVAFLADRYTFVVDMTGHSTLRFEADVCDPTGWAFHIGDSESNNGNMGDSGHTSNDAEIQIMDGVVLGIFGNDAAPMPGTPVYQDAAYLPAAGCATRVLEVRDSAVIGVEPPFEVRGDYLLRIDPPTDAEATAMGRGPDALWYIGINRTIGASDRVGTGTRMVRFCVRDDP